MTSGHSAVSLQRPLFTANLLGAGETRPAYLAVLLAAAIAARTPDFSRIALSPLSLVGN